MVMRLYELARELNYPTDELVRRDGVSLRCASGLSLLSADMEQQLRKDFPGKEKNPYIDRKKPTVKRVRRKPVPKKVIIDEEDSGDPVLEAEQGELPLDVGHEEEVYLGDQDSGLQDNSANSASGEDLAQSANQEVADVANSANAKDEDVPATDSPAPAAAKTKPENVSSLGKVKDDNAFQVGRIISDPKAGEREAEASAGSSSRPGSAAARRSKRKNFEQRYEELSVWEQANQIHTIPKAPPKKVTGDSRGTMLQSMQLVYGHEIPNKERSPGTSSRSKQEAKTVVYVPISIRDMSEVMGIKATDVIKYLMTHGRFLMITDNVDKEVAEEVAMHFEVDVLVKDKRDQEDEVKDVSESSRPRGEGESRPPVVTIMGHVDHGKTTLLDAIRSTGSKITSSEAGGITQHIGGYQVVKNGQKITFLDTPGHAAFTAMRARGANVTDIVVLVVAANDGVMPQTEEAVNHAKLSGAMIVVAMNKMDLAGANPDRVKEQLGTLGLIPEEWSGATPYVPVSALKGDGVDDLLEMILMQAEMLELKAVYKCLADGVVIEAHQESGRGVVVSVLIRNGILRKGDAILCGKGSGWLRQIEDENGKILQEAGPSMVVKIMGLSDCPVPGDTLNVMPNIKKAKEIAEDRAGAARTEEIDGRQEMTMESFMAQVDAVQVKGLNVIIKADVQGSIEALNYAVSALGNEEVKVKLIHRGVGAVTESDVLLAQTSSARILAFNVSADAKARRLAQEEGVTISRYSVIYELLDDLTKELEGMLSPDEVEQMVGEVEVREVFKISSVGAIAGCYVKSGYVERNLHCRLIRDGAVIYTGRIASLRRFKDDVKRVENRYECGVRLRNYDDARVDDILEVYTIEQVKKTLG